ncbi:energy transducer TonB [Algoriphagus lacus]|uniref:Energy transducer TonB n=1 Tax=Algoriphagus lacus TaxID=2056311 RepID=A0A418PMH5_9BACT|nr:energy transducer TonB [Algoriphagus lacus]RIW12578.1 energy transducer TonB [Algoriphagus lacus]
MLNKLLLILLTSYFSIGFSAQGQQRTTTKLNRHFIEIEQNDSKNHHYNKVETVTKTGETVTWIFDLRNRMVKQSKKGINPEGNYNQEITETFDSTNQLISQSIINLENRKYVEFHYRDGVKKAQVISHGNEVFEIWRNNPDSLYTSDHDDFGPGLDRKEWNNFLVKNLRYPTEARKTGAEGTVILAILVDENGNIKESEVANLAFVNPYLAKEALRVLGLFKGQFIPAVNLDGQPEEKWINIPLRFKLG